MVRLPTETWVEILDDVRIFDYLRVRLLAETWVEIRYAFWPVRCTPVRLLTETWVEISMDFNLLTPKEFVSLRRRELKSCESYYSRFITWFVSLRRRELKFLAKAAPWTAAPVRLPKETRVEIKTATLQSCITTFVSLRRRELKWDHQSRGRVHQGSSPYGDVSWNAKRIVSCYSSDMSSSPYGDVSWNLFLLCSLFVPPCSSPYGDVSWNLTD